MNNIKKIYLVGIKGVGMTALAEVLQKKNFEVRGSDISEKFITDEVLEKLEIKVNKGFDAENITNDIDMVIYSLAYNEENVEIKKAKQLGIKVISYPEALGWITNDYDLIVCAGTDGKTTTSAMLSFVMYKVGMDPTAIIGSKMNNFGTNAIVGNSIYFVLEGDEYKNKLQFLSPRHLLLTTINYDHPDFFATPQKYQQVFIDFIQKVPRDGIIAACVDNKGVSKAIKFAHSHVVSYGIENTADYMAKEISFSEGYTEFILYYNHQKIGQVELNLIGRHNILNALGVIAFLHNIGVSFQDIISALKEFKGTARRLEFIGRYKGALIYDDYAHTPIEIQTTLRGVRLAFPNNKLRVIFQPHTFTRTKKFLKDFALALSEADEVVLLEIYGSVRESTGEVSSKDLLNFLEEHNIKCVLMPNKKNVAEYIKKTIDSQDFVLTMGAGDVFKIGRIILNN